MEKYPNVVRKTHEVLLSDAESDKLFAEDAAVLSVGKSSSERKAAKLVKVVGSESSSAVGQSAPSQVSVIGGVASESVPEPSEVGTVVPLLVDLLGRLQIAGYNPTVNSLDVNLINPNLPPLEVVLADAIPVANALSPVNVSLYNLFSFTFRNTGDGIISIEINNGDAEIWYPLPGFTNLTTSGAYVIGRLKTKWIRVTVMSITTGNVTVELLGGN